MSSNLSTHQNRESAPIITCLMSVYNGEKYLQEAIDSVLTQTYPHFELLIINDASTDDTVQIIESYDDSRIRLIHNQQNLGLTKSLNKGIELSRGVYIARLDADDVCLPERFEKQYNAIQKYKVTMICDKPNYCMGNPKVETSEEIKIELLFHNCIIHSSAFFKRIIKEEKVRYNEFVQYAQDYELWTSSNFSNSIFALQEKLVVFREHENQLTKSKGRFQKQTVLDVLQKLLQQLGIDINEDTIDIHYRINGPSPGFSQHFIHHSTNHFYLILNQNKKHNIYSQSILKKRIKLFISTYLQNRDLTLSMKKRLWYYLNYKIRIV